MTFGALSTLTQRLASVLRSQASYPKMWIVSSVMLLANWEQLRTGHWAVEHFLLISWSRQLNASVGAGR